MPQSSNGASLVTESFLLRDELFKIKSVVVLEVSSNAVMELFLMLKILLD